MPEENPFEDRKEEVFAMAQEQYIISEEGSMRFVKNSMGMRVVMVMAFLLAAWVLVPAGGAMAVEDTMKLVASQASLPKMVQFIDLMKKNQLNVDIIAAADAATAKKSPVVVIEGGMDDPAVKGLISEVVGATEAAGLAKAGAKKMFVKENMWQPGQKVLVFAGANADAAAAVRAENREAWLKYFKEWFDLDAGPEGLKGY